MTGRALGSTSLVERFRKGSAIEPSGPAGILRIRSIDLVHKGAGRQCIRSLRIGKAITSLLKRALIAEVEVVAGAPSWREDDERRIGVAITDAGRRAIGVGDPAADVPPGTLDSVEPPADPTPLTTKPLTKGAIVLALLQRVEGATLAELIEATGWLPHTTRAALTGLRKKGHAIAKGKRDEVTCYSIAAAA